MRRQYLGRTVRCKTCASRFTAAVNAFHPASQIEDAAAAIMLAGPRLRGARLGDHEEPCVGICCPNCNLEVLVPESSRGASLRCAECGEGLVVPRASGWQL